MTQYKEITNEIGHIVIERTTDDGVVSYIPIEPANSDYQAYLDRDKPKAALSTPIATE